MNPDNFFQINIPGIKFSNKYRISNDGFIYKIFEKEVLNNFSTINFVRKKYPEKVARIILNEDQSLKNIFFLDGNFEITQKGNVFYSEERILECLSPCLRNKIFVFENISFNNIYYKIDQNGYLYKNENSNNAFARLVENKEGDIKIDGVTYNIIEIPTNKILFPQANVPLWQIGSELS